MIQVFLLLITVMIGSHVYHSFVHKKRLLEDLEAGTLDKFQQVNRCEDVEELKLVLLSFADKEGKIQGRKRKFKAKSMVESLELYMKGTLPPNFITREFGLRQQAMYIKYYAEHEEQDN